MSARAKRKSAAEKKAAQQKKIAIIGGVLLLAVIGFQAPKLLHHSSSPPVATDASGLAPQASTPATLVDASPPVAGPGQLMSFSLFKGKDPFVQQIVATTPGAASGAPAPTTPLPTVPVATTSTGTQPAPTTPTETTPTLTELPPAPPALTSTAPATTPTATTPAAPTTAAIETNGACEATLLGSSFPVATPFFTLVSIALDGKSVQIGIAGGSLQTGAPTVTLAKGKPLTLVNTADGLRYQLALLDACPPAPAPGTPTDTSASPATTALSATAPATTTPASTTPAPTTPAAPSNATDAESLANLAAVVPSIEAFYADNGTYFGMTLARLKSVYDQALDPSKYLLKSATATSYCIQSPASGGNPYFKNGPASAITQGRCP